MKIKIARTTSLNLSQKSIKQLRAIVFHTNIAYKNETEILAIKNVVNDLKRLFCEDHVLR